MIRVRGGSPPEIARMRLRGGTGIAEIARVWQRGADGVSRVIWTGASPMTVTASPDSVDGAAARPQPTSITTSQTTVTVTGGAGPYTYSWAQLGSEPMAPTAPNSPTTAFRASAVAAGQAVGASFVCTVTDRFGNTANSNSVAATALNYGDQTGGPIP